MKNENGDARASIDLLADRRAEIDQLSLSIRDILKEMIAALQSNETTDMKPILSKLKELQSAHLQVLSAEDAYHAKLPSDPDEDAIDYDEIRREIGRRLDRLRECYLEK